MGITMTLNYTVFMGNFEQNFLHDLFQETELSLLV